jgi:hypothetical protein
MFGMPLVTGVVGFNAGDNGFKGDQVRGFGFQHDGTVDTLFRFFDATGFNRSGSNAGGFLSGAAGDVQRRQVEAFVLAFDSGLAPIVGQQASATAATFTDPSVVARIALMVAQDEAGRCDLVVKGVLAGAARGWVYDDAANAFRGDRADEPAITEAALRGQASTAGQERSYTCVPPGSGERIGIDRDDDGALDRDEIDAGSDPADPASLPSDPDTTVMVRGTSLTMRDDSTAPVNLNARRISFRSAAHKGVASGVVPAPLGSAGDPTAGAAGATLTVYDAEREWREGRRRSARGELARDRGGEPAVVPVRRSAAGRGAGVGVVGQQRGDDLAVGEGCGLALHAE